MKAFFNFVRDRKWIKKNPAKGLKAPKTKIRPTLPYTQAEMVKILAAIDLYAKTAGARNAQRLRAFILLLRYSGMRIGDTVRCGVDRIEKNRLFLYTQDRHASLLRSCRFRGQGPGRDSARVRAFLFLVGGVHASQCRGKVATAPPAALSTCRDFKGPCSPISRHFRVRTPRRRRADGPSLRAARPSEHPCDREALRPLDAIEAGSDRGRSRARLEPGSVSAPRGEGDTPGTRGKSSL